MRDKNHSKVGLGSPGTQGIQKQQGTQGLLSKEGVVQSKAEPANLGLVSAWKSYISQRVLQGMGQWPLALLLCKDLPYREEKGEIGEGTEENRACGWQLFSSDTWVIMSHLGGGSTIWEGVVAV